MATDEPLEGRCGARLKNDRGFCSKPPMKEKDRCRYHGGKTPTKDENPAVGAGAGNANHLTHGLRSRRPAHELYPQLPDDGKEQVDGLVAAYVERWGWDSDDPRIDARLVDVCVDVWRRWRAKGILVDDGPSEEQTVGVNERGEPVTATDEHHLQKSVSRVDSDIRQNLKDLAPDDDPDTAVNIAGEGMTVNFNVEEVSDNEEFIDADGEVVE